MDIDTVAFLEYLLFKAEKSKAYIRQVSETTEPNNERFLCNGFYDTRMIEKTSYNRKISIEIIVEDKNPVITEFEIQRIYRDR